MDPKPDLTGISITASDFGKLSKPQQRLYEQSCLEMLPHLEKQLARIRATLAGLETRPVLTARQYHAHTHLTELAQDVEAMLAEQQAELAEIASDIDLRLLQPAQGGRC